MPPLLVDLLRRYASERPEAACLAFEDLLLNFRDLHRRSNQLATALLGAGVSRGDRVAILDHTSVESFELFFACAKLGAIMMPLNWRLSAGEIAAILADGEPKLILLAPDLVHLLATGGPDIPRISLGQPYTAWRDGAADVDPNLPVQGADPLLLLYTSGTTGSPKGVMISHAGHAHNGRIAGECWQFTEASVNLVAMPLFHIGGIGYGMMALSQGGLTVLLASPEPVTVIAAIERHGVTHAFFVPTVIQRLVEHVEQAGTAPTGLQRLIYGAAPIGESILRRAMAAFGCRFTHAYGMTETSGTVVTLQPEHHDPDGPHPGRLRSCGQPLPWVELALFDPASDKPSQPGAVGEIRIRSAMTMLGYWRNPTATAAAFAPAGWLCTGDAAWQDADGFLYIHDRYKDMIVSGGENIYPAELENVLIGHPGVAEVAVIGTAHPHWGETPRAYVVRRGPGGPTEAELIDYARDHLARYKCPTSVVFVAQLPRNASGKLLKPELRRLDRQRADSLSRSQGPSHP